MNTVFPIRLTAPKPSMENGEENSSSPSGKINCGHDWSASPENCGNSALGFSKST
jgi:hypothetical protein